MNEKRKILIIDDDEVVGYLVQSSLELSGKYEVLYSANGQDGIMMAQRIKPDLILLDILMPNMSGTDVIEQLLENHKTKDIPVIFLTGAVTINDIRTQGGTVGGRRFLSKPVSKSDLISAVESVFQ